MLRSVAAVMNPSLRRSARLVVALVTCLAALLSAREAAAQTITLNPAGVTRAVKLRSQQYTPMAISRADCEAGDHFFFPLTLGGSYGSYELQVWAGTNGTDCTPQTARTGTTPVCWQVYRGVPTSITPTLDIAVQDIVGQHKPPDGAPGSGTVADCNPGTGAATAPQTVQLTFMFVMGTGGDGIGAVPYPITFDLAGPVPPGSVSAGIGDTMLVLDWAQSTDTDLAGYNFYCDPVPGQEGAATDAGADSGGGAGAGGSDAGAAASCPDASTDDAGDAEACEAGTGSTDAGGSDAGGITVVGACTTTLAAGALPDPARLCGGVGSKMSTSGHVTDLIDGQSYAIAVAGVDGVGNIGPLSNVVCGMPQPVDDFYKLYRDAGGKAGGGFCSIDRAPFGPRAFGALAFALGGAALALIVRRRGSR